MPFVVDASVAACWLMPDEGHKTATSAYSKFIDDWATVPRIWWFEIRNVLIVNERRGRLDPAKSELALRILHKFPIAVDDDTNEEKLISLARVHRLSIYDAAYLELALRRNIPLATLDTALAAAANTEQVSLIG